MHIILTLRNQREAQNIVEFFPHKVSFPKVTLKDCLIQATDHITTILIQSLFNTVLLLQDRDPKRNAILKIAKLTKRVDSKPDLIKDKVQEDNIPALRVKKLKPQKNLYLKVYQ